MSDRRNIAVLTTGRQDYGILRSSCLALRDDSRFHLTLIAGGMHLDSAHGATLDEVAADGLTISVRLAASSGAADGRAAEMLKQLGKPLRESGCEALIIVGDRSETAAAALAATLARVPLIHLHGGEESEGAIDNALRHAITKLSHLHLVSAPEHARRVVQMGESPKAVHIVGAPGLDNLHRADLPDRKALEHDLRIPLEPPVVLVTYHPTTLGGRPEDEIPSLIGAMTSVSATWVITLPNNDLGSEPIREALERFASARAGTAVIVKALGSRRYFGMLRCADAMLGNSSSGILEAPAVRMPVVNVGDRQLGRLRAKNVIDAPCETFAIVGALRRALEPEFRASLSGMICPYGDGNSASKILAVLAEWKSPRPPRKRFEDGRQDA